MTRHHIELALIGSKAALSFDDIKNEDLSLNPSADPLYIAVPTVFHNKLDNANYKTQAYTEAIEMFGNEYLEGSAIPANHELYHETHRFEVFAKHASEPNFRQRDGLWFSLEDDAALLVSAKARFGRNEMLELLYDINVGSPGGFNLHDWTVKIASGATSKFADIKHYQHVLKGKTTFKNFVGVAVSPLFTHNCPDVNGIVKLHPNMIHRASGSVLLLEKLLRKVSKAILKV